MATVPSERVKSTASFGPGVVVIAAGLILGLRCFLFISKYSVNVLFYDQWDFLRGFFGRDPGLAELFFLQHGPHREGVGLIADKYLYPLTRWNVRAESFMIGASIFVAMLLALRLKKRLFGRLEYSDVIIPMIFLTLAQFETVIGTPNPAYSGFPLLLLMLYALALQQRKYLLRYGLVLLINFLLIYTGFGLFAGVITVGLFAFECYGRWRGVIAVPMAAPVVGLLVACVSLASFFVHYIFQPAVDCFYAPHPRLVDYPWFVALMFSGLTGIRRPVALVTVLGVALGLISVFILTVAMRRASRRDPFGDVALTIAAMSGYSLLFSVNTAAGRVCLGLPDAAQSSRYTTLLIPAFLAMYFYCLTIPSKKLRNTVLALLVLILIPGHAHISRGAARYADGKRAWVNCYRRTEDIGSCDAATHFKIYPDAESTRLKQKLDYLKQNKLNLFAD